MVAVTSGSLLQRTYEGSPDLINEVLIIIIDSFESSIIVTHEPLYLRLC